MRFFNGTTTAALALASLLLAACGRDGEIASTAIADADAVAATISSEPWLRDRLPADTIAYIRLPGPWALLSAPNGKAADAMFASDAHVEAIATLRAGFAANPILSDVLGTAGVDEVIRALNAIAAPIEIAVVAPGRMATPAAQALISTRFDTRDPARVAANLRALSGTGDIAFDAEGFATLAVGGTSVFAHLDATSGRLHLLGGTRPVAGQLQTLLAGIQATGVRDHAARTLEREIDASGQGFVVWLDAQSVKPWLMASLTSDRLWMRHVFEQTRAVAYGWGGVDGHGRLSLRLELEDPTWMRYLPQAERRLDVRSAGAPGFVFSMAMPADGDLARILDAVRADHGESALSPWTQADELVLRETGLSLADWLKPFGPELLAFNDDAGLFSAVRVRDRDAWRAVLDALVARGGVLESRDVGPGEIHHLSWTLPTTPPAKPGNGDIPALAFALWLQQRPNHAYWIEEGDWLVMASVPQPLIDRLALGTDRTVATWLEQTQGDNRADALVSLSGQADDLSRWFYHGYLGVLVSLGDIAGAPVDLFTLPSARQLGLPRETGVGMQVIASNDRLAFDLNYEHVALDGVVGAGGGLAGVAVAGVMAAVALPAYQDYTVRASVAGAIAAASPLKMAIAEHHASTGALPAAADVADLLDPAPAGVKAHILFEHGAIRVRFHDDAGPALAGRSVYLVPHVAGNAGLQFTCGLATVPAEWRPLVDTGDALAFTDLDVKYLPTGCRP